MNITYLELLTKDLQAQRNFYSHVLGLPVTLSDSRLEIKAGKTDLVFMQAESDFDGAYHFAFNIPENQFRAAKAWISNRIPLLHDEIGKDEFESESWNSHSVYFKDMAGNVLEFCKDGQDLRRERNDMLCFHFHTTSWYHPQGFFQVEFMPVRADQFIGADEGVREQLQG